MRRGTRPRRVSQWHCDRRRGHQLQPCFIFGSGSGLCVHPFCGLDALPIVGNNCFVTQISKQHNKLVRPGDQRCGIEEALHTRFFKALCDPRRASLLMCLAEAGEPRTVSQIARACPCDMSVVSRHLAMLRDAGILDAQKRGNRVYYSVRFKQIVRTLKVMAEALEACGKRAARRRTMNDFEESEDNQ